MPLTRRSRSICGLALAILLGAGGVSAAQVGADSAGVNVPAEVQGAELEALEARRRTLFAQMLADPSDLDVAFEYAGLSSRAGDLEAAISTLERMLIFAPGLPRLQLELGVLYYRLGAYDTAQLYFQSALSAPNVPDVVKARVDPYLSAIEDRTAADHFSGSVTAGVRYQTNANAAPELRTVSTAFGDLVLDDDALGEEDFNAFVTASFFASHDFENQGDRFEARLLTYGAGYLHQDDLNLGLAEVTLGPVFDLERFGVENASVGIYGIGSGVYLGDAPYLGGAGLGVGVSKLAGPRTRLSGQYEYRREEFNDTEERPRASDRSGDRFRITQRIQHQVSDRFGIFAALEGDRRSADVDYLSVWEIGGSLGWTIGLDSPFAGQKRPWTLGVSGGYAARFYDEADPLFSVTEEQEDRDAFVLGTLGIPLLETWSLLAQAGYREVTSNYDLRTFDNAHGSLAISKAF